MRVLNQAKGDLDPPRNHRRDRCPGAKRSAHPAIGSAQRSFVAKVQCHAARIRLVMQAGRVRFQHDRVAKLASGGYRFRFG